MTSSAVSPRSRPETAADRGITIGKWHVDCASRTVTDGQTVKRLSPRANKVLCLLAEAGGEPVARDTLLSKVWPNIVVGDDSLTQAMAELRRALANDRGSPPVFETIPKLGYRLAVTPVRYQSTDILAIEPAKDEFDLDAYGLCLDARAALARGGQFAVLEPERLTRMAVEIAPGFGLAHGEHAIALCYRWLYQRDDDGGLDRALAHAETALRLQPNAGTSHGAMAFVQGALGRADRARASLSHGFARDPNDSDLHFLGARILLALQDYRCAASLAERAAQLSPDDYRALFFAARAARIVDPARSQRNARACLTRIEARLAADPSEPRALNTLGPTYSLLGDAERAIRAVDVQRGCPSPCLFYDVLALTEVGDLDAASDVFEEVVDLGWRHRDWFLAEPTLAPLQHHARARKTKRAIGLN
ncbi:MAG: winged helix-turn-helix domain-containing protein [Roseibium sp.]|nr:winged helix-turn-helix domain-containing protein [Roseibium sp.]